MTRVPRRNLLVSKTGVSASDEARYLTQKSNRVGSGTYPRESETRGILVALKTPSLESVTFASFLHSDTKLKLTVCRGKQVKFTPEETNLKRRRI